MVDTYSYSPFDWLELQYAAHAPLDVVTVRKKLYLGPLELCASTFWDFRCSTLSGKLSLKERILQGSIRYLPGEHAIEYRKRFECFGLAHTYLCLRWSLLSGQMRLAPAVNVGLGFSGNRTLQPLSMAVRPTFRLGKSYKLKALGSCSLQLPNNVSLLQYNDRDVDEDYDGRAAPKLRLCMQELALVVDL